LFSLQVGLAALWRSWGLAPAAVVGHSIGEVAAAYVAGALDLKEAARVIVAQSQAAGARQGRGAMALVELDWQGGERALPAWGAGVAPAISHSPRQTVITGEQTLVAAAVAAFQQMGTTCRLIETSVAAHGPALAEAVAEIQTALDGMSARRPTLPLV